MKKLYLSLFIFLLVLPLSFAQVFPLLAATFEFNKDTTTSTSYVTIGSAMVNITIPSDINIDASFNARRVTGTSTKRQFSWRILFNGTELINSTIGIEGGDTSAILVKGIILNQSAGIFNITLQHKVEQDSLETSSISMMVRNYFTSNLTELNHDNAKLNVSVTGTDKIALFNTTFETLNNDTFFFIWYNGNIKSLTSNIASFFVTVDNINSPTYSKNLANADDRGFMAMAFPFGQLPIGFHNITFTGFNSGGADTTDFNGEMELIESIPGVNASFIVDTINIDSQSDFIRIINHTINLTQNLSFHSLITSQISKDGPSKRDVVIIIEVDGIINSTNSTTELEGSSDVKVFGSLKTFENFTEGEHNISILVRLEPDGIQTLTLTNISSLIFQTDQLNSFLIAAPPVDDIPITTLLNPTDLEVLNTTNTSLRCSGLDDNQLVNISLFHNASGSFVLNETSLVSGMTTTAEFNKTFNFNETILWNCESFDDNSQSAFASNNFTFSIQETFPFVVDIILLNPANNTVFTEFDSLNVDFSFNVSQVDNICSLVLNNIVTNTSNITTTEFTFGNFFNNSQTINWFVNCTDSGQSFSETRTVSINIVQQIKDIFDLNTCPVDTLPKVILFIFFIVLALSLSVMALQFKIPFIGVFGGFLLLSMSYFVGVCLGFAGILMFFLAMSLLFYHALIQ